MAVPLSYFARDKEAIKVFDFDGSEDDATLAERGVALSTLPPKASQWSPDGSALAIVDPVHGVQVITFTEDNSDPTTQSLAAPLTTQSFFWSPKSSVLATVAPGSKGSSDPNLHIWSRGTEGGHSYSLQASFCHPKLEKSAKVLQWTVDETLCARLLPDGTVHVLDGADLSGEPLVELKMQHPVHDIEFAPVRAMRGAGSFRAQLAVFLPDVRDDLQRVVGPAQVIIMELSSADGVTVKAQEKVKTNVAAGQAAELLWNSTGTALIAHCQTEVDESGQSYYGGSKLVLISNDGECQKDLMDPAEGFVKNGGAVQAVAWSPTRDEFILIHGFQPSQSSLFAWDEQSKNVVLAKILLEKAHRNTIRFNHFGSLVCLAGFGNLAGQVDFYGRADDLDADQCDFIRVASCLANCTVAAEWAPDGRHFITSVLAPRMRVDNGVSIWRALTGTRVAGTDFEELFDVQWRPEPPESLRFLDVSVEELQGASQDCVKSGQEVGGAIKKQAYRPPKARGESTSTVAAMMRGEVAAPDGDDRRKRQPRQTRNRDEELNPSPRPEEQQGVVQDGEQSQQASPDRAAAQQRQQQAPTQPWNVQQQLREQQQREQQLREQQQRDAQQQQLQQQRERDQLQRDQLQRDQLQQQQRREGLPQGTPSRPPPPTEAQVPPPQVFRAQMASAAAAGAAGGDAGHQAQQQRALQQQQLQQQAQQHQQAQQAQAYRGAMMQHLYQQAHAQQQQAVRAPEQATQGMSSHGLKMSCPQSGWQYVDPKKNIQGPFTLPEMQQWYSMGYFRADLPMRCDPGDQFVPFSELFPHPLIPFQSYPRRPTRGGVNSLR